MKAEKNWHQNSGAKRRAVISERNMAVSLVPTLTGPWATQRSNRPPPWVDAEAAMFARCTKYPTAGEAQACFARRAILRDKDVRSRTGSVMERDALARSAGDVVGAPPPVPARRASGPRGEHDRAAFADLVAEAAERIVRAEGGRALGMRRLAAAVGYAPNSIYNAVGDLDQVVLRVNARSFERLYSALDAAIDPTAPPRANAAALAAAYLAFVAADPAVWGLVHAHALAPDIVIPDWHARALARAVEPVEATLEPLVPDALERGRLVAALWAALHGLAAPVDVGQARRAQLRPAGGPSGLAGDARARIRLRVPAKARRHGTMMPVVASHSLDERAQARPVRLPGREIAGPGPARRSARRSIAARTAAPTSKDR